MFIASCDDSQAHILHHSTLYHLDSKAGCFILEVHRIIVTTILFRVLPSLLILP